MLVFLIVRRIDYTAKSEIRIYWVFNGESRGIRRRPIDQTRRTRIHSSGNKLCEIVLPLYEKLGTNNLKKAVDLSACQP